MNNLDINNIWNEYPRPQLERKDWINLNGPWLYSITEEWSNKPSKADGIILILLKRILFGMKKILKFL